MIKVEELQKTFKVIERRPGVVGYLKDTLKAQYREVNAIKDINFSIEEGEMVGLIGPNGAGKSTVIKILTGILYPTSGHVEVMGKVPWENRKKIAYDIGTVFGQKSQLWFHLPLSDSLKVLQAVYELKNEEFENNRKFLIDALKIEELVNIPVRKLSLGERMKCEIVAALIHNPRLLFLDEPTIGLDLISKQAVRETLVEINKGWGTTILLTSHDTGDIENVCNRAIVINRGTKVLDDMLDNINKLYVKEKVMTIRFRESIASKLDLKDLKYEILDDNSISFKMDINTYERNLSRIVKESEKVGTIVDITIDKMPLEEIIKNIYLDSQLNRRQA